MGAWVALNIAKKHPDLIAGIIGLAADPDFTENLLWRFLPEEKKVSRGREEQIPPCRILSLTYAS